MGVLLLSRVAQTRVPLCDVPEHGEVYSAQSVGSRDGETDSSSDGNSSGSLSETSSPTKQTAAAIDLVVVGGSPRVVAQPKAASGLPTTPGKVEIQTLNALLRGDASPEVSAGKRSAPKS